MSRSKIVGKVLAVSISTRKGVAKKPVERIELEKDKGVVGDAHYGFVPRQVSLLPWEQVDEFNRTHKIQIGYGAFAENIAIIGIAPELFQVGQKIRVGNCLLEITQLGKECHSGCNIEKLLGKCIMPIYGIFCRVLDGGAVQPGDKIEIL